MIDESAPDKQEAELQRAADDLQKRLAKFKDELQSAPDKPPSAPRDAFPSEINRAEDFYLRGEYDEAWHNLACARHYLEQYERAVADYTKALELKPNDRVTLYNRGISYCELEQYGQALADFDAAIELDLNLAKSYIACGRCHSELKQYGQALADLNKAIELNVSAVYKNRGEIYQALGKTAEAQADFDNTKEVERVENHSGD